MKMPTSQKIQVFLFSALGIFIAMSGCQKFEHTNPVDPEYNGQETVINEQTVSLDSATFISNINSINGDSISVKNLAAFGDIREGSIIISDYGDGVCKYVLDIQEINNDHVLVTRTARLDEVILNGRIEYKAKATPALLNDFSASDSAVTFHKSLNGNTTVTFGNWRTGGNQEISVDAETVFGPPEITFILELHYGTVYLEASILIDNTTTVTTEVMKSVSGGWSWQPKWATFTLAHIETGVPFLWIDARLQFYLGVEANINGAMKNSVTANTNILAGITYSNGTQGAVSDIDTQFDHQVIQSASGEITPYVVLPKLGFYMDGRLGPYIELREGLKYKAVINSSEAYHGIYATLGADWGGETDIFGVMSLSPSWNIFHREWQLFEENISRYMNVSPGSVTIGPAADSQGSFSIDANMDWSITDNAAWLSVSPAAGSGNSTITVTAASANTSISPRSAEITIDSDGAGSKTVTVTQTGATAYLNVSPGSVTVGPVINSQGSFSIESNTNWSVSESADWLSVSPADGSGDQTIIVTTAGANTSANSRSATVTVDGAGTLTKTVTVIQNGAAISHSVNVPDTPSGPSEGTIYNNLTFSTGGSRCTWHGDDVEYRFDWGDGNDYSEWGLSTQSHMYIEPGKTHIIKAQARCASDTSIQSDWSSGKNMAISGYLLNRFIIPVGSGNILKNPNKIQYDHNEIVQVEAVPETGYLFDHWEGDLSGSINPVNVTMNKNRNITARFIQIGETVTTPSVPSGYSAPKVGLNVTYITGGSVSNLGHTVEYRFDWGDGSGHSAWGIPSRNHTYYQAGICSVRAQARCASHPEIMSAWSGEKMVTARGHVVMAAISPSGAGSILTNPDKTQFDHNEEIRLQAVPAIYYHFDHWEGDLSGSANPSAITMDRDVNVTAFFSQSDETITPPSAPDGPDSTSVGSDVSFSTGGSVSNLGHPVEYCFDWGDGSGASPWGAATQHHTYVEADTYGVKTQARCVTHNDILSEWSSEDSITVWGHPLNTTSDPPGSGTVSKDPDKNQYNHNEIVLLEAAAFMDTITTAAAGYRFDHWGGDLSGNTSSASVTMNQGKNITACFILIDEVVNRPDTPTGASDATVGASVTYTTGGSASNLGHPVEYRFDWGDGTYSAWGGPVQSHMYTTIRTYTVRACARCRFHRTTRTDWSWGINVTVSGHILDVDADPPGDGTVTIDPDRDQYNHLESVQLTAVPATGHIFDGWSGDLSGNDNPETVIMDSDRSITARFIPDPRAEKYLTVDATSNVIDFETAAGPAFIELNTNASFSVTAAGSPSWCCSGQGKYQYVVLFAEGGNPPAPPVSYLVPVDGTPVNVPAAAGLSARRVFAFFPEYGATGDNSGSATLAFSTSDTLKVYPAFNIINFETEANPAPMVLNTGGSFSVSAAGSPSWCCSGQGTYQYVVLFAEGGNPPTPPVSWLVPVNGSSVSIPSANGLSARRIFAFFPEYGATTDNSGSAVLTVRVD